MFSISIPGRTVRSRTGHTGLDMPRSAHHLFLYYFSRPRLPIDIARPHPPMAAVLDPTINALVLVLHMIFCIIMLVIPSLNNCFISIYHSIFSIFKIGALPPYLAIWLSVPSHYPLSALPWTDLIRMFLPF